MKKIITNMILLVAIIVFCISAYQLVSIYLEYRAGDVEYEEIAEEAVVEKEVDREEAEETERVLEVDFDKLLTMNSDTAAWIDFEEPDISYPVVYGVDNEKYLTTTFEGNQNASGALFIDYQNERDMTDKNTFIYGHNMKNGSMFGRLRKYKDENFFKEHPYFNIYTPDGKKTKYEIFSVCIVEDATETYRKQYADDADYQNYIDYIRGLSLHGSDVKVDETSRIVTLSTCTNVTDTQRLVLHAVAVESKMLP